MLERLHRLGLMATFANFFVCSVNHSASSSVVSSERSKYCKEIEIHMEDILVPSGAFFMIGWIVWFLFSSIRRYKIAKFQSDVQSRLLQRLDTSQSLLAYVETPAGKQFIEGLGTERVTPYERILSSTQAAIIITAFGIALLVLRSKLPFSDEAF